MHLKIIASILIKDIRFLKINKTLKTIDKQFFIEINYIQ